MGAGCVRKIPGVQNLRFFELKTGSDAVAVSIKEYTHSPRYSGLTIAGVFEGMALSIFRGGIPAAGNAPPFELKTIDSGSDAAIKMRYKAIQLKVDALFPCGTSRFTNPTKSNYLVTCSRLSKSNLLKPSIISCTLNKIQADSYFTRL